jgi:hypothetical protein
MAFIIFIVFIISMALIFAQVEQLQELLSAARAEVQIRGENIQILEQNLAARRRRDVAMTIADDEGQTVRIMVIAYNVLPDVYLLHT